MHKIDVIHCFIVLYDTFCVKNQTKKTRPRLRRPRADFFRFDIAKIIAVEAASLAPAFFPHLLCSAGHELLAPTAALLPIEPAAWPVLAASASAFLGLFQKILQKNLSMP